MGSAQNLNIKDVDFLKIEYRKRGAIRFVGMKQLIPACKDNMYCMPRFFSDSGQGEHFRTRAFVEQFLVEHGFRILSRPNDPRGYIRDIIYGQR